MGGYLNGISFGAKPHFWSTQRKATRYRVRRGQRDAHLCSTRTPVQAVGGGAHEKRAMRQRDRKTCVNLVKANAEADEIANGSAPRTMG